MALKDRVGKETVAQYGNKHFGHLLKYLPEHDGLTDAIVPMNIRCGGGSVIGLLDGTSTPDLADIRNDLAHGHPFDAFPYAGLFELARDLIEYAYRTFE